MDEKLESTERISDLCDRWEINLLLPEGLNSFPVVVKSSPKTIGLDLVPVTPSGELIINIEYIQFDISKIDYPDSWK